MLNWSISYIRRPVQYTGLSFFTPLCYRSFFFSNEFYFFSCKELLNTTRCHIKTCVYEATVHKQVKWNLKSEWTLDLLLKMFCSLHQSFRASCEDICLRGLSILMWARFLQVILVKEERNLQNIFNFCWKRLTLFRHSQLKMPNYIWFTWLNALSNGFGSFIVVPAAVLSVKMTETF